MIMYKTTHCIDYTQIIQNYILLTWKYSKISEDFEFQIS
jgi:hypothetical protein